MDSLVLLLRPYFELLQFTLLRDHNAHLLVPNLTDKAGHRDRWRLRLSEFKFGVVHLASVKHHATDSLSSLPIPRTENPQLDDDLPVFSMTDGQL